MAIINQPSSWFMASLILLLTLWQLGETKPRWNLDVIQDPFDLPELGDDTHPTSDIVAYPETKLYPRVSRLDALLRILTRIRSNAKSSVRTNRISQDLDDIFRDIREDDGLFQPDMTQKRSSNLHDNVEAVLPPWQEFCLMLRMGNCWRYKRSVLDNRTSTQANH